jgi:peptidyl-dipeptidase A
MTEGAREFVEAVTRQAKSRYVDLAQAMWEAATSGSDEANAREKQTQAANMRFWSDREQFERAQELDRSQLDDPLLARAIRVIYLSAAKGQQDEAAIEKITGLEARVRAAYYNFRAPINGKRVSDNELDRILQESRDDAVVRQAYLASKLVGAKVADTIRELAHTRNQVAQEQGYRDHFQRSLTLSEIDEPELFGILGQLDEDTSKAFSELKREIDTARAERFGINLDQLRPWHYGDRFFQRAPEWGDVDLDSYFRGEDPVELSLRTYDGWGLEVRDILERSDLYAREGKNQHAFCLDLDREGDIRTLNNLEPNRRWISTLLHELGHAVYDRYLDRELPWILRKAPHTLSTEAIAILTQSAIMEPEWLAEMLALDARGAADAAQTAKAVDRAHALIFTRWILVMTHFERDLYQNPDRDLDGLWWDLVEMYQQLNPPDDRSRPDWAAKYHIALAPVYYQNYELGALISAQLKHRIVEDLGGFVGRGDLGDWLRQRVFEPGARRPWKEHVEHATGEALNPAYFIAKLDPVG